MFCWSALWPYWVSKQFSKFNSSIIWFDTSFYESVLYIFGLKGQWTYGKLKFLVWSHWLRIKSLVENVSINQCQSCLHFTNQKIFWQVSINIFLHLYKCLNLFFIIIYFHTDTTLACTPTYYVIDSSQAGSTDVYIFWQASRCHTINIIWERQLLPPDSNEPPAEVLSNENYQKHHEGAKFTLPSGRYYLFLFNNNHARLVFTGGDGSGL